MNDAGHGGRGGDSAERLYDGELRHPGEDLTATASARDDESAQRLATDTIYRLLAVRARSRSELMHALRRKEIDEEIAESVLRKFVDAGLVDDTAFAEHWVDARQRYQKLGRTALGFELRRKGIDEQTVAETLSNLDDDSEAERARELVRGKLSRMTAIDVTAKRRRLLSMLARKGYSESLAIRIVREEMENSETDSLEMDDPFS